MGLWLNKPEVTVELEHGNPDPLKADKAMTSLKSMAAKSVPLKLL